jgi:hypothetical protein
LHRPFIVIGFLSWASAALAEPVSVANDDLKELVTGSLVEIDTPLGTKIPIRFGDDGLVSGQALDLASLLGSEKDRGRWWVDGEKLCSKWFRWFDAEVRCITVQQDGSRLYWRKDDGETGTATLIERGHTAKPDAQSAVVAQGKQSPAAPPVETSASADIPMPLRKPAPPTVFAKADAAGASVPAKYRVAATDDIPASDTVSATDQAPTETVRPTEVALTDRSTEAGESVGELPMIRFGGNGLLEASARVAPDPVGSAEVAPHSPDGPVAPDRDAGAHAAPKVAALPSAAAARPPHISAKHVVAKPVPVAPKREHPVTTTASIRPVVLYRVRGVGENDVLNVRRGPSEDNASIGAIPATGRRVMITGQCSEVWCPVQYGRIRGWVNSLYLAEDSPQASSSGVYMAKP